MEAPPERKRLLGAVTEYATRGIRLYVILFIIEVGIFFVVANLPFFPGEQAFYNSQNNQINNQFQGASLLTIFWGIFTNNLNIALREMIPGIGVILFAASLYATARILEAIADTDHASPLIVLILLLLLFPHSYIELPAYAVATGEGLFLLYAFGRWLFATGPSTLSFGLEFRLLLLNLAVVIAMLLIAALFESVEIQLGAEFFLLTWIPFAALVLLTVSLYRRLERIRKENRAELPPETKKDDSSYLSLQGDGATS